MPSSHGTVKEPAARGQPIASACHSWVPGDPPAPRDRGRRTAAIRRAARGLRPPGPLGDPGACLARHARRSKGVPRVEVSPMRSFMRASVLVLTVCGAATSVSAAPITLPIAGNQALGTITLPGGIGAALTLTFENAVGLTPSSLDVSASLVNPLDPALLARLPPGGLFGLPVTIPLAFPVLLEIEPSAGSTLSFSGVAKVELYTFNLNLSALVPLAIFKATAGGPFRDNTTYESSGSYRVGGSEGDFSEFLIVVDTRSINTIINQKFNRLQSTLNAASGSMPGAVASALQSQLTTALGQFQSGQKTAAIASMQAFSQYVKDHSGADIPDVWQANNPGVVYHAGLLRSD